MNQQQIFNKVSIHLLTQNEQSLSPTGTCMYRGTDGLKCAIGCLIPDHIYRADMEGKTIAALFGELRDPLDLTCSHDLLVELQEVHDLTLPDAWTSQLFRLAWKFNLSFDVLKPWFPRSRLVP